MHSFKLHCEKGSSNLVVIGGIAALVLAVAIPLVSDIGSEMDYRIQQLCVGAAYQGARVGRNGVISNSIDGQEILHTNPEYCQGVDQDYVDGGNAEGGNNNEGMGGVGL